MGGSGGGCRERGNSSDGTEPVEKHWGCSNRAVPLLGGSFHLDRASLRLFPPVGRIADRAASLKGRE